MFTHVCYAVAELSRAPWHDQEPQYDQVLPFYRFMHGRRPSVADAQLPVLRIMWYGANRRKQHDLPDAATVQSTVGWACDDWIQWLTAHTHKHTRRAKVNPDAIECFSTDERQWIRPMYREEVGQFGDVRLRNGYSLALDGLFLLLLLSLSL